MAAVKDTIGTLAPTVGTIGGGIVGAYFGGPAGAAAGASIGGGLGGAVSAGIAATNKPKASGASGLEKAAAQKQSAIVDELLMQGGLSETQYSRLRDSIFESAQADAAGVISLAREQSISPLVLDKLVNENLRKMSAQKQKALDSLTSMDIAEARNQLGMASQANLGAGQLASNVQTKEVAAEDKIKAAKEARIANLVSSISGVASTSMKVYAAANKVDPTATQKAPAMATATSNSNVLPVSYNSTYSNNGGSLLEGRTLQTKTLDQIEASNIDEFVDEQSTPDYSTYTNTGGSLLEGRKLEKSPYRLFFRDRVSADRLRELWIKDNLAKDNLTEEEAKTLKDYWETSNSDEYNTEWFK